jgi:hypothetical protein
MKWNQNFTFLLTIIIEIYIGGKKYYRSKLLNHLKRGYGLSKMSVMLGLGIVKI